MSEKQLYTVIHSHEYGVDSHVFRSNHFPTDEEVIGLFGIDYEPDRGEDLEINLINEELISELK